MAEDQDQRQEHTVRGTEPVISQAKNSLLLGNINAIDMTGLTDEQRQQLQVKYAEGLLDVNKKAQELKIAVGALDASLHTMAEHTKQASASGDSLTITQSQSNPLGRTEIVIGNTDKAAKGRLSRSQAGERDNTLIYVIIGAVVVIIVAFIFAR